MRGTEGHQQAGGLQDVVNVTVNIGLRQRILPVEPVDGIHQIRAMTPEQKRAGGEMLLQGKAQLRLISVMVHQRVREMNVVGECKRVGQIMGQLAESIVVPGLPAFALLQRLNFAADVTVGIGETVSAESTGAERASQEGEGIAVRLKGPEQKSQFMAALPEALVAFQKRGSQQFVAAFLQRESPQKVMF